MNRILSENEPSPNGDNGRDGRGRFGQGNRFGKGNPYAQRVAELRSLILEAVTDADLREIVRILVERAKGGDITAIREVLNRLVGKPTDAPDPVRLEFDERRLKLHRQRLELQEDRLL